MPQVRPQLTGPDSPLVKELTSPQTAPEKEPDLSTVENQVSPQATSEELILSDLPSMEEPIPEKELEPNQVFIFEQHPEIFWPLPPARVGYKQMGVEPCRLRSKPSSFTSIG